MVLKNFESTQPAFGCNLMVKRDIDCVYQNKKTGSSCTTGLASAEVTLNLCWIYSHQKHFYRNGPKHRHGHCWLSQHLACFSEHAFTWHPFKQHSVTVYIGTLTLQENHFCFVNAVVLELDWWKCSHFSERRIKGFLTSFLNFAHSLPNTWVLLFFVVDVGFCWSRLTRDLG